MNRMLPGLAVLTALAVLTCSADAARLGAGNSVLWVGLNGNESQLVGPTTGSGAIFGANELGAHVAYSYFISNAWTWILSGGFDVGNEQFEPTIGPTEKFTSRSFNVRLGMDRYAFINDDVALYAGPGILYWRGNGKFSGSASPATNGDWPDVSQIGFNGRVGMYARIGGGYGLFGHIGQVIAMNSASDDVGKNTWWSNHHEGSVGLAFDF
jgi:hypothetical protein